MAFGRINFKSGGILQWFKKVTGDVTFALSPTLKSTVAKIRGTTVSGTTGSGNVAFSASPTFTGTLAAAAITATSEVITSTSANSLAVGANGTTNPGFKVDNSVSTPVGGIGITASATGVAPSIINVSSDTGGAGLGIKIVATNASSGNAAGGPVNITAGTGFGTGDPAIGGAVTITGGSSNSGNNKQFNGINLLGGNATSGRGGDITITAGSATSGFASGDVFIAGADGLGAAGGTVTIKAGGSNTTQTGVDVSITGGSGGTSGNQAGGRPVIQGGAGNSGGAGGAVPITGGTGGATGAGGAVTLTGGTGGATSGNGGAVTITGGSPATSGAGGAVSLIAAAGVGSNQNGGNVTITAGAATGAGTAGTVTINGVIQSPTLLTPALGTPASGVLSSCTTATNGAGANNTTLPSQAYVDREAGFINNAISVTSNAGSTSVNYKFNTFTNSSAATMTITCTTASAIDGQPLIVRIYDFSAAAQTISWVNTENSTNVSAPTTSAGSTTLPLVVGFVYNSATSKWRCIASA
jgi:hypothetical protein